MLQSAASEDVFVADETICNTASTEVHEDLRSSSAGTLGVSKRRRGLYGRRKGPVRKSRDEVEVLKGWDTYHHDVGYKENELKPKALREYFSRPQSLPELRQELHSKPNVSANLDRLDSLMTPRERKTMISADARAPLFPERHVIQGDMLDRDRQERPWNNRFHSGCHIYNDHFHPVHRQGFAKRSPFETSSSQAWRRIGEMEFGPSIWRDVQSKRSPIFGPVGV